MSTTAGRPALERLDAHLEALRDGADLPFPDDLAHLADLTHLTHLTDDLTHFPDDPADTLVRRTLGRLARLPREPKDVLAREAGGLLTEFRAGLCPWNAAALRLLDDAYVFAATGPRRHAEWAHDVLAVLHRSVRDPRGWIRLDWDRANTARDTVPAYPFDPPAASALPGRLHRLEPEAAVAALAVMAEEWQSEPAPVRSRPDRDAVLADARTLLDRYGPAASHWTNATAAALDPAPDFLAAGLRGTRSHSFLTSEYLGGLDLVEDLGLVVVTDDEVGVFWSFGAY
ncbi:hypothetical protein [Streptomyces sp. NPDC014894]|uniref:hypothetical protein n=1 Tax=Streptomyces sp. NPDC014894 TaxID=3364931 RepID=UPI003702F840